MRASATPSPEVKTVLDAVTFGITIKGYLRIDEESQFLLLSNEVHGESKYTTR